MPRWPLLLLTRPEEQARRFAGQCRAAGFEGPILSAPLMAIVPRLPERAPETEATLLFTSAAGVEAAAALWNLKGRQGFAVGARTAEAARKAGMTCRSAEGDVSALEQLIARSAPSGPLRHLHGAHQAGNLAAALSARGFDAAGITVYDQQPIPLTPEARTALGGKGPVIAPLFSPRSAQLLQAARPDAGASIHAVAMSPAVAAVWNGTPSATVVDTPTADAMLEGILRVAGLLTSPR